MDIPLVRINFDSPEKISELYGIGLRLAEQIVEYRSDVGFFQNPSDLACVSGISERLANTLTPHIDWTIPIIDQYKKRQWFLATFRLIFVLGIFLLFARLASLLIPGSRIYETSNSIRLWSSIWLISSFLLVLFGFGMQNLTLLFARLSTSTSTALKLERTRPLFGGLELIGLFSVVLSIIIRSQLASFQNDQEALQPIAALFSILFVGTFLHFGPVLLVMWRPVFSKSPFLARCYDFGLVMFVPLLAVWSISETTAIFIKIMFGLFGVVFGYLSLRTILKGESFFSNFIFVTLDIIEYSSRQNQGNVLLKWLNINLPNPDHQMTLKRALDKAYPPSRSRTVLGVIVFGAGSWLVVTAIGAIIEWFIQGWLDRILLLFQ